MVVLYATNIATIRLSQLHGLTALDLAALRFTVAGLLLFPYVWRAGLRDLGGIGWARGTVLAALAGAPYIVVFFYGLRLAPASHGAVLNNGVVPSVVFLGLVLRGRDAFSRTRAVSLAAIVLGVALVTGASFSMHGPVLFGDALLLYTGISWGVFTLCARLWELPPLLATAVVSVLSLLYLPVYVAVYYHGFESVSLAHVLVQTVFQGLVLAIGTVYLVTYSVRALGPQRSALFNPLVPVLTTLLAIPLLGELPTAAQWLGIGLVVAGMFVAAR